MESKVSRDIREALEITESKSRLFEEDNQPQTDEGMQSVTCPHCTDVFMVTEGSLYEDEDGDVVAICTLCENVVVIEDHGTEAGEGKNDDGDGNDNDSDKGHDKTEDEFVFECPYCEGEFDAGGAELFEDEEGCLLTECPYCKKGFSFVDESKDTGLSEMTKRVVRHGKRVTINVRSRKRRMSPKQKAALKKARKKAHTGKARRSRKRSMRVAESMHEAFTADPTGYTNLMEAEDTGADGPGVKKRVRGGKVTKAPMEKEHRVAARSFKLSAKRRAALTKAQRKSQTGDAKRKRAKSRKIGAGKGLYR